MKFRYVLGFALLAAAFAAPAIYKHIEFKQNVTGYVERAGYANTVESAKHELDQAITELERRGITSGYTSMLYRTPNEDVGFWYQNLKKSQEELATIGEESSQLERSNVLMKLRESVTQKDEVRIPPGLSRFPHNTGFVFLHIMTVVCGAIAWFGFESRTD